MNVFMIKTTRYYMIVIHVNFKNLIQAWTNVILQAWSNHILQTWSDYIIWAWYKLSTRL